MQFNQKNEKGRKNAVQPPYQSSNGAFYKKIVSFRKFTCFCCFAK